MAERYLSAPYGELPDGQSLTEDEGVTPTLLDGKLHYYMQRCNKKYPVVSSPIGTYVLIPDDEYDMYKTTTSSAEYCGVELVTPGLLFFLKTYPQTQYTIINSELIRLSSVVSDEFDGWSSALVLV